jgi:hypothetical protein
MILVRATPRYWCDETIAAPGDRLDAALPGLLPIKDPAKRRDLDEEITLLDHRLGPDGGDDLVLGNDVAPLFDQSSEDAQRALPNHDRNEGTAIVAPKQPAAGTVEPKLFE